MKRTKTRIAREQAKKALRPASFKARRSVASARKAPVIVGEEKETLKPVEVKQEEERFTIMRYLGKPQDRMKARARELEVIDVAPCEIITFGSLNALEAYRRDLYAINGEKTSHFRTQRRGLSLKIWRDE